MQQWEKPHPLGSAQQLPLLRGKAAKGKSEGEKSAHIKKESAQQSHDYLKTPQTVTAPVEPAEEVAFSCARTGFPAHQPSGNEALPASPTLSPPWLPRGQGVAAPTAPGLGEAWKWPGNWLWVDLIPSDFPFCELFPSLLTLFPLLNMFPAWDMLFFIKQGRTSLSTSLCSRSPEP